MYLTVIILDIKASERKGSSHVSMIHWAFNMALNCLISVLQMSAVTVILSNIKHQNPRFENTSLDPKNFFQIFSTQKVNLHVI
jgi:hypothetical protein